MKPTFPLTEKELAQWKRTAENGGRIMSEVNNIFEQLKNMSEDERNEFVKAFNAMEVKQNPTELPELVVCAALKYRKECRDDGYPDEYIVLCLRHCDQYCQNFEDYYDGIYESYEQGFITNKNRFVTREEALKIAQANKQIRRYSSGENPTRLFSEDLY